MDYNSMNTVELRDKYMKIRHTVSDLENTRKEIGLILRGRAMSSGVEDSVSGHKRIFLGETKEDGIIELQKRTKTTVVPEVANVVLKEKGIYEQAVKVEVKYDEDKIQKFYQDGVISDNEILGMFKQNDSFALYVK